MPGTVKGDLFGSMEQRGVSSRLADRAVRRVLVKGLNTGVPGEDGLVRSDLDEAIQDCLETFGVTHHKNIDLPLRFVRANKWGLNSAWVTLGYARSRIIGSGINGAAVASFDGSYEPMELFRLPVDTMGGEAYSPEGLPNGLLHGVADPKRENPRPVSYMWNRPMFRILIPTTTHSHPASYQGNGTEPVPNLQGTINKTQVSIGGFNFPATTLRFDSMKVRAYSDLSSPTGFSFRTLYHFTAAKGGFVRQNYYGFAAPNSLPTAGPYTPNTGPSESSEPEHITSIATAYLAQEFTGAFLYGTA